ncbi:nuclear transport factor 2 family protein [Spongiactinospora gelatinilytica]|uniref:Nuclear transport factor 2 family protein n=1 Tax=Spongiactinospora gelatinilytica TaxID=2666298 RepID=A0A2W2G538_9ACTN|nr:nuclear transport factor 2 family protein [Spongiactinospora gelatinilytica]PZG32038.1 nuclear transport factor 2 family protein [Spongiactinospora gelatinilytica]
MTAATDVLDLVNRWAAAEEANDPVALGALLADDFVGVGPLGFVLGRDQWLGRFGHGLVNRSFVIEDPKVYEYGTAAYVVGVDVQETTAKGRDVSDRFRVSIAAVRPDDRWLIAGVHLGPLKPPAGHTSGW